MNRTKDGRLQADPKRFPNGIKKLADYVRRSNSLFCRGDYWGHFAYCDSIAIVELLLQYYCDSSDTIAIVLAT